MADQIRGPVRGPSSVAKSSGFLAFIGHGECSAHGWRMSESVPSATFVRFVGWVATLRSGCHVLRDWGIQRAVPAGLEVDADTG
jgi:hypothetical protein